MIVFLKNITNIHHINIFLIKCMNNINKLKNIFKVHIDELPIMKFNFYTKPKTEYIMTVNKNHIGIMKEFIKDFNKLNNFDKTKLLNGDGVNNEIKRIVKVQYNDKVNIIYTSYTVYHCMMINIMNKLMNKKSIFDDVNKSMINTELILLEYVKPEKNTRKLVLDRKEYYINHIDVLSDTKKITNKKVSHIKKNIKFYMDMYKSFTEKKLFKTKKIHIYIAKDKINRSLMFYTTNLKKDKIPELKEKIDYNDYKLLGTENIENELHKNIILDKYVLLFKPSLNPNFKLSESKMLNKVLNINTKKKLKQLMFVRVNKLFWKLRLEKHNDKYKNKIYVYKILNNKSNNYIYNVSDKTPLNTIDELYNALFIKQRKDLSNFEKDLFIYKEKYFSFNIIKIVKSLDKGIKLISKLEKIDE